MLFVWCVLDVAVLWIESKGLFNSAFVVNENMFVSYIRVEIVLSFKEIYEKEMLLVIENERIYIVVLCIEIKNRIC